MAPVTPPDVRKRRSKLLKEPKQQRTRERLERIYEAAEALFAEHGFANTSMRDIARAVPCSMSAIYDRFESKQDLLLAMHERHRARTIAGIERRAPGGAVDLREFLPKLVHFAMEVSRANRGLNRAMLAQASFDPSLAAKERELRAILSGLAFAMIAQGAEQIDHPDPQVAADFAARLIAGVMLQRYDLALETQHVKIDDARFEEELVRVCLRYLGLRPSRARRTRATRK